MRSCDQYHDWLLDSLFGLLEEKDILELRAHVEDCSVCRQALDQAQKQHALLARAARVYRVVPAFVAPDESQLPMPVSTGTSADILPMPQPVSRTWLRRPWPWVAAAAALLLAIGGFWFHSYNQGLTGLEGDLAQAREQEKTVVSQLAALRQKVAKESQELPAQLKDRATQVQVTGPAFYHVDAPSQVRVEARDLDGQPVVAKLTAQLVDTVSQKELFRSPEVTGQGEMLVSLPGGLPIQEGQMVQLGVEAQRGDRVTKVWQTLRAGEVEYLTHVALNKSTFQIGDKLFFRTLSLQRFSLRPPVQPLNLRFALIDPAGRMVREVASSTKDGGIGGGEILLTSELASGAYVLEVTGQGAGKKVVPQRRPLEIWREPPPQLHFDRPEYRAGDKAQVEFMARKQTQDKDRPGLLTVPQVTVNGLPVQANNAAPGKPLQVAPDAHGNVNLQVQLPQQLSKRQAVVEIQLKDGQRSEKLVQTIPVVPSTLDVQFFPEGGALLAGVPNRVYYQVNTPAGEAAAPQGHVILLSSKDVLFDSERSQGQGVFTFTPDPKEKYTLRITSPATGLATIEKPDPFRDHPIRTQGVALHVPTSVSCESEPLPLVVRNAGQARQLVVVAACRGRVVDQRWLPPQAQEVILRPAAGTRGVVRITVYAAEGHSLVPLAERLVYRLPSEQLTIAAQGDKKVYRPGEQVRLKMLSQDEKGQMAASWLLAAVVDEQALSPADHQNRSLAANFYLLSELQHPAEVEDADLVLNDQPQARQALDLFLGIQGWRRFIPADAPPMVAREDANANVSKTHPADARGSLGQQQTQTAAVAVFNRANDSLANLQAQYREAQQVALARLQLEARKKEQDLREESRQRALALALAASRLAEYRQLPWEYVRLSVGFIFLVLLVLGSGLLLLGVVLLLGKKSPTRCLAFSFASLALCLCLFALRGLLPMVGHDDAGPTGDWLAQAPPPKVAEERQDQLERARANVSPTGIFAARGEKKAAASAPPPLPLGVPAAALAMLNKAEENAARDRNQARGAAQLRNYLNRPERMRRALEAEQAGPAGKGKTAHKSEGQGTSQVFAEAKGFQQREYQHKASPSPDVQDTLLWHPALWLAAGTGQVIFDLGSQETTYRVLLLGHTAQGRLGFFEDRLQVQHQPKGR